MSGLQRDPLSVIDDLVGRFRNDWRAGIRPRIEDHLEAGPQADGHELFRAFLAAEVHERRMLGESPAADEYRDRFRQFSDAVAEEFADTRKSMADSSKSESSESADQPQTEQPWADIAEDGSLGGRYRIISRLGAGAFGTVYKAQDIQLDRLVALKTPRLGVLGSEADAQRFLREARAAGQLRHPNIVPVYDAGKLGQSYFIASGFIDGQTLAERLEKAGTFSERDAALLIQKLALALHSAHSRGVIHRDVKPANVMIDNAGEPLLMDFGMARRDEGEELQTQSGMLIGTPAYMSPEQHAGESHLADARSDQWALGVMLYELLTGRRPFQGSIAQMGSAVRESEPTKLRNLTTGISKDLETICLKCLEKEPEQRYASCQHLAEELGRWLRSEPITARPIGYMERAWRWCRRNPVVAGLSMTAAVLLLVVAIVASVGYVLTARAQHQTAAALLVSEAERQRAEEALQREAAQRKLAEAQRREAERNLYFNRIALADSKQLACDFAGAERELDLCPVELRHWEWGYLKRLCHLDLKTVRLDSDSVYRVVLSTDGKRLALTPQGGSKKIVICDATTGKQILSFGGHKKFVSAVAFSPDGKQLASAAHDEAIEIWDVATGKSLANLQGHTDGVGSLAFSPDGKQIAAGTTKTVNTWIASTGKEVRTLKTDGFTAVAFSPDGKRLATAAKGAVKIWDAEKGTELLTLSAHRLLPRCIAFSPDGRRIAAGGGQEFLEWRVPEGDNVAQIWDAATGKELVTLYGHSKGVTAIAFSPDGKRLVTGSADRTARLWDAKKGHELTVLRGHNGIIVNVAFNKGATQVISASDDRTVKIWDTSSREAISLHPHGHSEISYVTFSPDGKRFAFNTFDKLKICDAATGHVDISISVHCTNRTGLAFSPDGRRIVSEGAHGMTSWDTATGHVDRTFPNERGSLTGIAFTPDGKYIACGSFRGTPNIWNATTGEKLLSLGHQKDVASVAFSPDGKHLACAFYDGTLGIWDATTGQKLWAINRGRESFFVNVAFSPDGKRIATGVNTEIRLFDASTGRDLQSLRGHGSYVVSVAFSADGKRIISGCWDTSIKIWDVATGQELLTRSHRTHVTSVAFSPDGKHILSGSRDGVNLWEAAAWKSTSSK